MKSLKTPLRYPGGKSRAITKMSRVLPDMSKYKEYREPFIGGGSIAIEITLSPKLATLTDNDIEAVSKKIITSVEKSGGFLRA